MRACRFSSVMSGSVSAKTSASTPSNACMGSSMRRSTRSQPRLRAIAHASSCEPRDRGHRPPALDALLMHRVAVARILEPARYDRARVDRADRERLLELRRARDDLAVLVDRNRVPVEDELVLAADQ